MAAGDVVNTAARLQAAAPEDGILVDEATYRRPRGAFDYRALEPGRGKGKAEPVPVWEARGASRLGVVQHGRTPLVGRERELGAAPRGTRARRARAAPHS